MQISATPTHEDLVLLDRTEALLADLITLLRLEAVNQHIEPRLSQALDLKMSEALVQLRERRARRA